MPAVIGRLYRKKGEKKKMKGEKKAPLLSALQKKKGAFKKKRRVKGGEK